MSIGRERYNLIDDSSVAVGASVFTVIVLARYVPVLTL